MVDRGMEDHTERTVVELRACLQAFCEGAECGLVLLDGDGVICMWSGVAEKLFGYRENEVLGRADTFLVPADRLEETRLLRQRALAGEACGGVATERLCKAGRRVPVLLTLTPLRTADERGVAVMEMVRPLTGSPPPSAVDEAAWGEADREMERLLAGLPCEEGNGTELVGAAPVFEEVLRQLERLGPTEATVLILGESGTGKELVARAIHEGSGRRSRPFVAINCAALPRELLESELFGHERGAFTGAVRRKVGQLEVAEGGTVFLDEICELPLELQPKLLRVLETRTFTRVGGVQESSVDVRFLAATNRPIKRCVQEGNFRADLYYRLGATRISLPPLRERLEDLPLLSEALLRRIADLHGSASKRLTEGAEELLTGHAWPGNVRELRNVLEQGFLLSEGEEIGVDDLSPLLDLEAVVEESGAEYPAGASLEQVEAEHIRRVLEAVRWHKTEAARVLGIGRDTLYRKMRRYGLDR